MPQVAQRKTVTVLFSDLVESTQIAESIDPEALAELLDTYFTEMRSIIERHGGSVEKFIGDAVVGMFGVPATHEDDALRAIRAALAMQAALDAVNEDVERRHGLRLAARIGINTGSVAVTGDGSGSQPAGMALGHAMNMAARLEQAAAPAEVLIGETTHELVAAFIEAESVGPLKVKGSSVPIGAWRVVAIAEGAHSGWEGEGLFVGREKELAAIEAAFASAISEPACVVVTVVAPPGMGKSRFAAEATRRLAGRAQIAVGRCVPYGEGVTYAPLLEIAASLQLPQEDERVARAREALGESALASPDERAWAFKQMLETVAEQSPVVAVVDDLHWAEPLLIDVLDYVVTLSAQRPILLLCLSRPDLFDTRPEWAAPRPHATTIRLEPLTAGETDTLLATNELLAADAVRRREIVEIAAGVPLFAEQMAALRSEGHAGVPPTIRALLAARIDRLQAPERLLLERAAIQGEVFDRETLAALVGEQPELSVGSSLMALVRRELIRPERASDGRERFRFSHALLRDAIYDQMAHRLRAELHERYADRLASSQSDVEMIAHHLERAHWERSVMGASDADSVSLGDRAGTALHAAGRKALARKEWRHALNLLERARAVLSESRSSELGVLVDLMSAHGELGEFDAAEAAHGAALESARAAGDTSRELRAEMGWAQLQVRRGDVGWQQRIPEIAERAVEHFSNTGSHADLANALLMQANPVGISDLADAINLIRAAVELAERAGDERLQIELWDELGGVMIFGPTPYQEVGEFVEYEIDWARRRGIAFTEADGLLGRAYVMAASGDGEAARQAIARVRTLFAELPGFVSQLGETDILAASIEQEERNIEAAEPLYRRALEVLENGGHALWWRGAALGLAAMLFDANRPEEARAILDEVDRRGLAWGARPRSRYLQARARLAMLDGNPGLALNLGREAVDVLAKLHALQDEARAREGLGDLFAQAGDHGESAAQLNIARDLYAAKGYRPGEWRVSAKLEGSPRP
ncbi:MAG: adenylate/guanylate cyclase domain-containing protein [Chloroflexota bacterium]